MFFIFSVLQRGLTENIKTLENRKKKKKKKKNAKMGSEYSRITPAGLMQSSSKSAWNW